MLSDWLSPPLSPKIDAAMHFSLILLALALLSSVATGFALARVRPALAPPLAALLAAIPLVAAFGILAAFLSTLAQQAPLGLAALLVFGLICLLCGFGLGMVGHMLGSRRNS
jgi:amino acid permease